jgi:hypothetical protein
MKLSGRTSLIALISGFLLLMGFLFHTFILENFVRPVALVLWLFWRFLQVFDQHLCWGLLIFGILFYAFYRFIEKPPSLGMALETGSNATLEIMNNWRTMILITSDEIDRPNLLKRDLGKMVATLYASKQPGVDYFEIYSSLKEGLIPLPERIYKFLFWTEPASSRRSLKFIDKTIWNAPGKWYRHLTGRELAEYYRTIEEVLIFMDSMMETNHDAN